MIYTSVSIKSVIAKFLRNTRLSDSSFMDDLLEWIPEAMGMMQTRVVLKPLYKELTIKDYSAKLPCGLVELDAVAYNGRRLREGSTVGHVVNMPSIFNAANGTVTVYVSDSDVLIENHLSTKLSGDDLKVMEISSEAFYKLQLDYIQTSFKEGKVVIYFLQMPVDCDGYPLIPDNENYKEALYWFLLTKAIEAGYEHPLFDWNHCWNMWEHIYAPRAVNEIRYPSVDGMERLLQSTVRLVPPTHFYTDFSTGAEQYQEINM